MFKGLKKEGIAVISGRKGIEAPDLEHATVIQIPANDIAQKILGRPLGNTTLLGAFAAATGEIQLESLQSALKKRFLGDLGRKNADAAEAGFEAVKKQSSVVG